MARGTRRPAAAALALTCLAALAVTVGAANVAGQSAPNATLSVGDTTVAPGENGTVRLAADEFPNGLAGFRVTVALESPGAAEIVGASYPDRHRPTTEPAIGSDGLTVDLEGSDLSNETVAGAENVTLATLDVRGVEPGSTGVTVRAGQVDDDDGGRVRPAVEDGTVTVATPTATPTATEDGGSGEGSTSDGGATGDGGSAGDDGGSTAGTGDSTTGGAATTTTAGSGPGFSIEAAIGALFVVSTLLRRR